MVDLTYGPADQEALDRREAQTHAREYAELSANRIDVTDLEYDARQPTREEMLDRHPLLAEREHTHGDFAATAMIAQRFKDVSKSTPNWNANLTDVQRESLEGIFVKIARILSGDPNHPDHWRDIEGGAHLVSERL